MKDAVVANTDVADQPESSYAIRDPVDISSNDRPMPDGDIIAKKDIADYCSVRCDEDEALVIDVEIVEIHDVAGSTEGFRVLPGRLDTLGGEEERVKAF